MGLLLRLAICLSLALIGSTVGLQLQQTLSPSLPTPLHRMVTFPNASIPQIASSVFWFFRDSMVVTNSATPESGLTSNTRVTWNSEGSQMNASLVLSRRNPQYAYLCTHRFVYAFNLQTVVQSTSTLNLGFSQKVFSLSSSKKIISCAIGPNDYMVLTALSSQYYGDQFQIITLQPSSFSLTAEFNQKSSRVPIASNGHPVELTSAIYFHPPTSMVFIGATGGRLCYFNLSSDLFMNQLQTPIAGAGDILSMAPSAANDGSQYLYLGTSIGAVIQWNLATLRITNIALFLPPSTNVQQNIRAMAVDDVNEVLFFGADGGGVWVGRCNLYGGEMDIFDYNGNSGSSSKASVALIQLGKRQVLTSQVPGSGNSQILLWSITSCNYTCSECVLTDPAYCGFCGSQALCSTGISTTCNDLSTWDQGGVCPAILGISPASGAINGGTLVAFTGSYFLPSKAANYKCRFGATLVNVTSINATTIVCKAPPSTSVGAVNASIAYLSTTWGGPITYTYYSCNLSSCSACFAGADCGWCLEDGKCSSGLTCLSPKTFTRTCPVLSFPNGNSSGVVAGGEPSNFRIRSSVPLASTGSYTCAFGSATTPATRVSSTDVTCTVPPSPGNFDGFVNLNLNYNGVPYTPSPALFEFYDCTKKLICYECARPEHPQCRFCISNLTCVYLSSGLCPNATDCPTLTGINPPSVYVGEQPNLVISGAFPGAPNIPNPTCNFGPFGSTNITSQSLNSVQCPTPPLLNATNVPVSFYSNGQAYTNPTPLTVYGTSSSLSSSTSANPWALSCYLPYHYLHYPWADSLSGGTLITIAASIIPVDINRVSCLFGNISSEAVEVTAAHVKCVATEAVGSASSTSLALVIDNTTLLTDPITFNYYDCEFSVPGVPMDCDTCLSPQYPACTWCGTRCTSSLECTNGQNLSSCPSFSSLEPISGSVDGNEVITFTSPNTYPPGAYSCLFSATASTTVICSLDSDTTVTCLTPKFAEGQASITLLLDGVSFEGTRAFAFYHCVASSECNSLCLAVPECGWCAGLGECTGQSKCQNSVAEDRFLWLRTCPSVVTYAPSHVQIAVNNTPSVPENITIALNGLPATVVDPTPLACDFDNGQHILPALQVQDGVITCEVPIIELERDAILLVRYGGFPLSDLVLFRFLNCFKAEHDCLNCVASKEECGFCLPDVRCSTSARCQYAFGSDAVVWSDAFCPEIVKLEPQSGSTLGGDVVTLSGSFFLNRETNMTAEFVIGNNSAPLVASVRFLSSTELEIQTPVSDVDGVANVRLYFDRKQYARQVQTFTYNYPPDLPLLVGSTVGPALGALGVLSVILVLVARRRRILMFAVRLKEPDYMALAYGDYLTPQWQSPKDHSYEALVKHLDNFEKDPKFVFLIGANTAPTEQDAVAKALVNYYTYGQICSKVLNAFAQEDIRGCRTENTIFRNNSLASRMFKFYSKIVGIPLLFNTLARFIVEINTIAGRSKEKGSRSGGVSGSLLSLEMELDVTKLSNQENDTEETEANLYQLILACQKVFITLQKALPFFPPEFIEIFAGIRNEVISKWPESSEAIYKAIGAFLFLRFYCPAITAPHVYGLLPEPPNAGAQRQLVLIGKVMQNLANLITPTVKEQFMLRLSDFFAKNIPKMLKFYLDLLAMHDTPQKAATERQTYGESPATHPPKVVAENALGAIWMQIYSFRSKINEFLAEHADYEPLLPVIDELYGKYKAPKKIAKKGDKRENKSSLKETN